MASNGDHSEFSKSVDTAIVSSSKTAHKLLRYIKPNLKAQSKH